MKLKFSFKGKGEKEKTQTKKDKIVNIIIALVIFALFICVRSLVYPRLFAWFCVLTLAVSLISFIYLLKLKDDKLLVVTIVNFLGIFAVINLISVSADYYYIDGSPFWIISILLGLIISGVISYKLFRKHNSEEDMNKNAGGIIVFFLVIALFVCIGLRSLIVNFNFILDTTEPETYMSTIEHKRQINRRKGSDSYEFKLTVDGETFYLDVPISDFNKYDVGDNYRFTKYQGAFNYPFYIAGTEE